MYMHTCLSTSSLSNGLWKLEVRLSATSCGAGLGNGSSSSVESLEYLGKRLRVDLRGSDASSGNEVLCVDLSCYVYIDRYMERERQSERETPKRIPMPF